MQSGVQLRQDLEAGPGWLLLAARQAHGLSPGFWEHPVPVLLIFAFARIIRHKQRIPRRFRLHFVKARPPVPVRVRGRIVTILTSETSIRPIVQVTKTPRRTYSRRVRPIERTSACRMTLISFYRSDRGLRGRPPLSRLRRLFTPASYPPLQGAAARTRTRTRA